MKHNIHKKNQKKDKKKKKKKKKTTSNIIQVHRNKQGDE